MNLSNIILKTALRLKPVLVKIIPLNALQKLKAGLLKKNTDKFSELHIEPINREKYPDGINLIGNICGDSGLGQSCRLVADIILATGMSMTVKNYYASDRYSMSNTDYNQYISNDNPYNINIFHINAHECTTAFMDMGRQAWDGRYNIAYWLWELEEFPEEWVGCMDLFDEIWTPAEFISNCLRKYTNKPVNTVPYCVTAPVDEKYDRNYFQLPEDKFLFLMMFDSESVSERKNPKSVLKAFKKAFLQTDKEIGIVVKVNEYKQEDVDYIHKELDGYENVYILTETLSKVQVNSLIKAVDVYISLHRAEGFGLVMAEAMIVGTPVIATNWSANTEFMNDDVACMVDYKLIELEKDIGPYKAGSCWADPDTDEASGYMRKLYEDRAFGSRMAERASKYVKTVLNMEKSKKIIMDRIEQIYLKKKRLAIVNQRYGMGVNGGSEYYTRMLAEHLSPFYDIEVITTCAKDYDTWENYYEPGESMVHGIKVRRFPVRKTRKEMGFLWINRIRHYVPLLRKLIEKQWIAAQGPYSPECIEYIKTNSDRYDCFVFVTYLYYLTVYGMKATNKPKVLIPTAHDEEYISMNIYKDMFTNTDGIIYLTDEEKQFVEKKFHNTAVKNIVAGMGIEVPKSVNPQNFRGKYNIKGEYILYAGRIEEGKGCAELIQFFRKYSEKNQKETKLVLMGKKTMEIPSGDDIITTGFVSEEDKFNGMAGAVALVLPSEHESLSISVLEAMALGIPVLVNGRCGVLKAHCDKSGAGYFYRNYEEFEEALGKLLKSQELRNSMGEKGRDYVAHNYDWREILAAVCSLIG